MGMLVNPYLDEFHRSIAARWPVDGADMSYAEWLCKNTRYKGKPFSFAGYEFQIQIVNDLHADLSCIKPSQVGMSEIQIRKNLGFLARNRGTTSMYTFPNEKMYKRFSKTRVRPLIVSEQVFSMGIGGDKPVQSMDLYEVNGSYAYFTGMTEGDATSIPADFLIHDEIDISDQSKIGLYQSRLQNSIWRITQSFSTPTFPGFGVDARFSSSDQHEYMIRCPACNHWQIPTFDLKHLSIPVWHGPEKLAETTSDHLADVDLNEIKVICERCARPLDTLNPTLREWVARFPARKTRGYRIRPFVTRALSPSYIFMQLLKFKDSEYLRGWYNTVLGEAFSDGSNQLTEETVKRCFRDPTSPTFSRDVPCAIGIDMGLTCHIVVGRLNGGLPEPILFLAVPVGELHDVLKRLCSQYNIVTGAIDRHPYTPTADQVFVDSDSRIIPTEYRGSQLNVKRDQFGTFTHAQVDRTATIDRAVRAIRDGMQFYGYGQYKEIIIQHLTDMIRVETPDEPARWEKKTGHDHFMHALSLLIASPKIKDLILVKSDETTSAMFGIFGLTQISEPALIGRGKVKDGSLL